MFNANTKKIIYVGKTTAAGDGNVREVVHCAEALGHRKIQGGSVSFEFLRLIYPISVYRQAQGIEEGVAKRRRLLLPAVWWTGQRYGSLPRRMLDCSEW
jgi:hypothetical protein